VTDAPIENESSGWPSGTRALVTGAGGFIGSHLVRRLVEDGVEVHGVTSAVSSVYPIRLVDLRDHITLHEANLADRGAMDVLVDASRPTHVFHLGAYTHVGKSWQRVDECVQVNVQGTVNLLQALSGSGYTRFLNMGTSEIYGDIEAPFQEDKPVNPISPYAASKYAAERFCRVFFQGYGFPIVLLRPFNAYGPAQTVDRVIPEIIIRALRGEDLLMTQGRQTREFNYVEDVADGLVRAALTPGIEGQLFNLGCAEDVSIRELTTARSSGGSRNIPCGRVSRRRSPGIAPSWPTPGRRSSADAHCIRPADGSGASASGSARRLRIAMARPMAPS
jgi:nucleoside-diphosphate-sugar epimerase